MTKLKSLLIKGYTYTASKKQPENIITIYFIDETYK